MQLSEQVCSLEQSIKLKKLGVKQESLFVHDEYPFDIGNSCIRPQYYHAHNYSSFPSAFTVAELGVMLPDGRNVNKNYAQCITYRHVSKTDFCCAFESNNGDELAETLLEFDALTEAQCRAAMLIYLLENNIINVDEVNKRL